MIIKCTIGFYITSNNMPICIAINKYTQFSVTYRRRCIFVVNNENCEMELNRVWHSYGRYYPPVEQPSLYSKLISWFKTLF